VLLDILQQQLILQCEAISPTTLSHKQ